MSSIIPRFTGRLCLRLRSVRSTMAFASCPMARNYGLEASPEKAHRVGSLKTMPLCCSKIMVLADPKSIEISALEFDRDQGHSSMADGQSVEKGQSVSCRVDSGGARNIKKKMHKNK